MSDIKDLTNHINTKGNNHVDDDDDDDDDDGEGEGGGMKEAYSFDDLMNALSEEDKVSPHSTSTGAAGSSVKLSNTLTNGVSDMNGGNVGEIFSKDRIKQDLIKTSKDSGKDKVGGGEVLLDGEGLYESSEGVRERKRRSASRESETGSLQDAGTVGTDIAGRFPVCQRSPARDKKPSRVYEEIDDKETLDGELGARVPPPDEQDVYENSDDFGEGGVRVKPGHEIYENVLMGSHSTSGLSCCEDGWSSSEFEEYDNDSGSRGSRSDENMTGKYPYEGNEPGKPTPEATVPLRKKKLDKISWRKSKSAASETPSPLVSATSAFDRLTSRLSSRIKKEEEEQEQEYDDSPILEIDLDVFHKYLIDLPPSPDHLSALQIKRRHVVSSIIDSERNYSTTLRQLILEYEQPLLDARPQIISGESLRQIFYKIREILQCHKMFQIELAEVARTWDEQEKIGDTFTAAFSKSIVFEVYSAFVNNFSQAMELAKKLTRTKPAFAEFLKQRLDGSVDRLSLFGLMVKPVQRFPQFIMLLQDLLKYTPREHHDRLALQLALTELDTFTNRLNDTKKQSDAHRQARILLTSVIGRTSIKLDSESYLVRNDDVTQIKRKNGETRTKSRRLYLLNDQLVCTKVLIKEGETGGAERCTVVWSVPVKDVQVLQPSLPSSYRVSVGAGKSTVSASKTTEDRSDESAAVEVSPARRELDDMLHDLTLLESMTQLASQLRLKYEAMSIEMLYGMIKSLQLMIRQKCDVDRCLMSLSLPANSEMRGLRKVSARVRRSVTLDDLDQKLFRGGMRMSCTFQMPVTTRKHEWLLDLQNVKLALDPRNLPAWTVSENDQSLISHSPLFIQPLPIDIRHDNNNKIQCSTLVTLPSLDLAGGGVQHLWVCNGDDVRGQVNIVSVHTNIASVVECFRVTDSKIRAVETVPGTPFSIQHHNSEDKISFSYDTVWMATEDLRIVISRVIESDRETERREIKVKDKVTCIKYTHNMLYIAYKCGELHIYPRDQSGAWLIQNTEKLSLSSSESSCDTAISCLLVIGREVYAACQQSIHVITASLQPNAAAAAAAGRKLLVNKRTVELTLDRDESIECMVKAGVGLMVSCSHSSVLRLYHIETFVHLQDINVASPINSLREGKDIQSAEDPLHITCLLSDRGLLWIGTSQGFILTLPLPRLEGVPKVRHRPTVSYHGHVGPVRFLSAVSCGGVKPAQTPTRPTSRSSISEEGAPSEPLSPQPPRHLRPASVGPWTDLNPKPSGQGSLDWVSTPDLTQLGSDDDDDDDVCGLYCNLLRGVDDTDMDSELTKLTEESGAVKPLVRPGSSNAKVAAAVLQQNINAMSSKMMKLSKGVKKNLQKRSEHKRLRDTSNSRGLTDSDKQSSKDLKSRGEAAASPRAEAACADLIDLDCSVDESLTTSTDSTTNQITSHDSKPTNHVSAPVSHDPGIDRGVSVNASHRRITVPACPEMISSDMEHVYSNRSVIVVSGGEGYVHWSLDQPISRAYDDTCLMLWQC